MNAEIEELRKTLKELKKTIRKEHPRLASVADWGERHFGWFNLMIFIVMVLYSLAWAGILKTYPK